MIDHMPIQVQCIIEFMRLVALIISTATLCAWLWAISAALPV